MKKLLMSLLLLTSFSAFASISNGVSAIVQVLEGQELIGLEGLKDKTDSDSRSCRVDILSHDENHLSVYVGDHQKRIGVDLNASLSSAQIIFKNNQIIVKNMASEATLILDQNNLVQKVEVKSMAGLGSVYKSECEL